MASVAGMRDRLAHSYFAVDEVAIWETIQQNLPVLQEDIRRILAGLPSGPGRTAPTHA